MRLQGEAFDRIVNGMRINAGARRRPDEDGPERYLVWTSTFYVSSGPLVGGGRK